MASASHNSEEKLLRMLECPICLEKLKNAKMLKCFHFFCKECLENTKELRQKQPERTHSSYYGAHPIQPTQPTVVYKCSVCRQDSKADEVGNVPIVNDILDALNNPIKNNSTCAMCKAEKSDYRCMDCKATYCQPCKTSHDAIPTCTQHKCVAIREKEAGGNELFIDKLVFCQEHHDKVCELNCIHCSKLICVLCKAVTHSEHKVETIEDGIKRLTPISNKNMNVHGRRQEILKGGATTYFMTYMCTFLLGC